MSMPNKRRTTTTQQPRCYEIRVRRPIGPTMLAAFPEFTASKRGEDTVLCGSLHDQSALYGVLHQLEALGLELLEVRCQPSSGCR
jgi:monoterpene epsilon-lactone hydrolase